jgi:predicted nuclease of predicted toxin-antitoxin system
VKLLLDQGLPVSAAVALRHAGWIVDHVSELGWQRATDADILDRAREMNAVCVTLDSDFHALLAIRGDQGPSAIRIRQEGLRGPAVAAVIEWVWNQVGDHLAAGAVVTVTEQSLRVRRLPIAGPQGTASS